MQGGDDRNAQIRVSFFQKKKLRWKKLGVQQASFDFGLYVKKLDINAGR